MYIHSVPFEQDHQNFDCTISLNFWYFRDLSNNQLTGEIPFNIGFLQVATLYVILILYIK
jgi:hypothetical protein